MQVTFILPSDGLPMEARRLGLFELDRFPDPSLQPFTTPVIVEGVTYQQIFSTKSFKKSPEKPAGEIHDYPERSQLWYTHLTYLQYQAAVHYEHEQAQRFTDYRRQVIQYIYQTCLPDEARERIVNLVDWREVLRNIQVPELSMHDLRTALWQSLNATIDEDDVLDAIMNLKVPDTLQLKYSVPRFWEMQTMSAMQMTEAIWADLPLPERARKVVVHMLPQWASALEAARMQKAKVPNADVRV